MPGFWLVSNHSNRTRRRSTARVAAADGFSSSTGQLGGGQLGKGQAPVAVAALRRGRLGGVEQPLLGVLPDRLEQLVRRGARCRRPMVFQTGSSGGEELSSHVLWVETFSVAE
jgi:hypothetical protein